MRHLAEKGLAVLLVTHNVLEAERSVEGLAIVDHGRVVASGTAASLKGHENGYLRLEIVLEPAAGLPTMPDYAEEALIIGRRVITRVETDDVEKSVSWAQCAKRRGLIEEYSIGPATLEDVYVRIVGQPEDQVWPSKENHHVLSSALAS